MHTNILTFFFGQIFNWKPSHWTDTSLENEHLRVSYFLILLVWFLGLNKQCTLFMLQIYYNLGLTHGISNKFLRCSFGQIETTESSSTHWVEKRWVVLNENHHKHPSALDLKAVFLEILISSSLLTEELSVMMKQGRGLQRSILIPCWKTL